MANKNISNTEFTYKFLLVISPLIWTLSFRLQKKYIKNKSLVNLKGLNHKVKRYCTFICKFTDIDFFIFGYADPET